MADELFEFELATPERLVLREKVSEVQIPARDGYIGVLPGHAPLLSEMASGYVCYTSAGRRYYMAVNGGFIEVLPDHVRVLADTAEKAEEIDVQRAEASLKRAQERLTNPNIGLDVARALSALHRAQARLDAAKAGAR
ncbi:MAG: F0F1 ATP synthase subunit epsilon [Candidatus Solibacter usitatus]|nr:F0F1 ATP synthase subunit epsilon [Candidatus Solibacter usitatus]